MKWFLVCWTLALEVLAANCTTSAMNGSTTPDTTTSMETRKGSPPSVPELPCGDWIPYKNETCIKLVDRDGLQTKEDADVICEAFAAEIRDEEIPRLITIKTEEKQEFLNKLLFEELDFADNIWLGLELGNDSKYLWNDGINLTYTNWADNGTKADHERHCVQMESGQGEYKAGKWVTAYCNKRNAVLCERIQPISTTALHKIVLDLEMEMERNKQEAEEKLNDANQKIKEAQEEISFLTSNPVPVGFIYVQLPGQLPPTTFWSQMSWKDISKDYAGLFFRVEGGDASPFGQEQQDNTRRLAGVGHGYNPIDEPISEIPTDGSWSRLILLSGMTGRQFGAKFRLTTGEIRPRNKAVKMWQRVK